MKTIMPCIHDVISFHNLVEEKRRLLKDLFGDKVSVTIGGSYALKYQSCRFSDREIHDVDFIVRGLYPEDTLKATELLTTLRNLGMLCQEGSSENGFTFGCIMGKPIDILIDHSRAANTAQVCETLDDILRAKKWYCDKAIATGKKPRTKDLEDIKKIEEEIDLPF